MFMQVTRQAASKQQQQKKDAIKKYIITAHISNQDICRVWTVSE